MGDPLNGTLEIDNPAEFLRNQNGVFEVTSPYGHTFLVTCRQGTRMSAREVGVPKRVEITMDAGTIWRVRRLSAFPWPDFYQEACQRKQRSSESQTSMSMLSRSRAVPSRTARSARHSPRKRVTDSKEPASTIST